MLLGIEAAAAMLAVPLFLLAVKAPFGVVVLGGLVFGVGAAMLSVLTITAIQREIAPALVSRVMAVVQLAGIGLNPVGYVLAEPLMGFFGARTSLALSGVCVIVSVAVLCSQREIRGLEQRAS
jgi:hypothetical protein